MAKNTLADLNNHLFEQLERLMDDDVPEEKMKKEILRSKAVTEVAEVIVRNGELAFRVMQHMDDYRKDGELTPLPEMLKSGGVEG